MALTTWRTILLGMTFDIYSDHDSLKYLRRSGVAKYRVSEQEDIGEHGCPLRYCELIVYSETNSFRGIV